MIPVRLKMENFFSHKDSEIDFTKFDSALLIGNTEGDYNKSNGSGKSAIFESILWCLFNKSRASMMDDIIRWGETTCSVTLEFKHNSQMYRVKRNRNRMNSTSTVEFSYLDKAGDWNDISCSTSGDTNSKIETTIKLDYKTFVNSIYFRQNDISEFAEADPSRKKEILKSIVDISRWDSYEKSAKKVAKDIGLECKVLKKSIEDYDQVVERLAEVRLSAKALKAKTATALSKKKAVSKEIETLGKKYATIKKSLDTDAYDRTIEQLAAFAEDRERLLKSSEEQSDLVKKYSEEKGLLEKGLDSLMASAMGKEEVLIPEGKIEDVRAQLTHYKSQKSSSEEMLKNLRDLDISPDHCYACRQSIGNVLYKKLKKDYEDSEEGYKSSLSEANKEVLILEKDIDRLLKTKRENEAFDLIKRKIEGAEYKIALVDENLQKHTEALNSIGLRVENLDFKIKNNKEVLESIKNEDFQSIRKKLKTLKAEYNNLVESISSEDKEMGRLLERESLLSERETKMLKDKEGISKKMRRASLFEKLSKMFGKNGIQAILLDTVIEDLEKTANTILASICNEPAVIVLETQRLGADGSSVIETLDLKVRKDGHLQNFKSLSGGEKFRISLALRIALSDMSSRYGGSSLEFLLLDEVNSPLDRYGVETLFVSVIRSLEDKYKILVITHDESLKEKFDNVIDITKVNGESELEFTTR